MQFRTGDAQGREALIACILDVCTELAQGVCQNTDGPLLHTLRSGNDTDTGRYAEVGGEKTHGRPCRHDVYMFGVALQRTHHDAGIVAIAQIAECLPAMGKGVQDKRTVTDTFGCRQPDSGMHRYIGSGNGITHSCIC